MTATHHERTVSSEQVRLRGGDLAELATVVAHFAAEVDEKARWFIDGDTLVLETPLGDTLVGGKPYRIPPAHVSAPRDVDPDAGQG